MSNTTTNETALHDTELADPPAFDELEIEQLAKGLAGVVEALSDHFVETLELDDDKVEAGAMLTEHFNETSEIVKLVTGEDNEILHRVTYCRAQALIHGVSEDLIAECMMQYSISEQRKAETVEA